MKYLKKTQEVIIGSSLLNVLEFYLKEIFYCFLGGTFIIFGSGGLKERAVAGKPSVTRLTQRSWMELKPSGIPKIDDKKILTTSPIFEEIMYLMKAY